MASCGHDFRARLRLRCGQVITGFGPQVSPLDALVNRLPPRFTSILLGHGLALSWLLTIKHELKSYHLYTCVSHLALDTQPTTRTPLAVDQRQRLVITLLASSTKENKSLFASRCGFWTDSTKVTFRIGEDPDLNSWEY